MVEATKYYMNKTESMFESAMLMKESNLQHLGRKFHLPKIDMRQIEFEEHEGSKAVRNNMSSTDLQPNIDYCLNKP